MKFLIYVCFVVFVTHNVTGQTIERKFVCFVCMHLYNCFVRNQNVKTLCFICFMKNL